MWKSWKILGPDRRRQIARHVLAALAAILLFAPAALAQVNCVPGWVHPVVNSKTDEKSCKPCDAKTYQSGKTCLACPAGQISDPGSTACCTASAYAAGTDRRCKFNPQYACQPGSAPALASDGTSVICTACAAGTYGFHLRTAQGQSSSVNGCAPCPPGQTSDAGSTSCHPKTAGPTTPGQINPLVCRRRGLVLNADGTGCVACAPPTVPNADGKACITEKTKQPGLLESAPGLPASGPAGAGAPSGGGGGGARGPAGAR